MNNGKRNVPPRGYGAHLPPAFGAYGYVPPPGASEHYPPGYVNSIPVPHGQEATAPGTGESPAKDKNEPCNWFVFIGGICAGSFLSVFGFLFLLCFKQRGKKKKDFIIGCTVRLILNLAGGIAIFLILRPWWKDPYEFIGLQI